ncbi:MAG TPA: metalloregulator ArsR/SmtB family transcription factor [Gemmatimonadaceae bacterium]
MTPTVDGPTIDDVDAVFKAFADPTRIRILNVLAAGELCVCDVVDLLRLPQPTVSRHLAYLRRMGLVDVTRETRFAHYRLAEAEHAVHEALLTCMRVRFPGVASLQRERRQAEVRTKARASEPC